MAPYGRRGGDLVKRKYFALSIRPYFSSLSLSLSLSPSHTGPCPLTHKGNLQAKATVWLTFCAQSGRSKRAQFEGEITGGKRERSRANVCVQFCSPRKVD